MTSGPLHIHFIHLYLLEANDIVIHVFLLSVVSAAKAEACNTPEEMKTVNILSPSLNNLSSTAANSFDQHETHLYLLFLQIVLLLLDAEWRCLYFLMVKVCFRSSGVTSHLSIWDRSGNRTSIFHNSLQTS